MTQHYTQCNLHWSSFWLLCVLWVRTNIMAGIHLCSIIHSSFTNLKTLSHIPFQTKSAQPLWGCRLVNSKVVSTLKLFSFPLLLQVDSQSSTYRTKNSWWLWPLFRNSPTSTYNSLSYLMPRLPANWPGKKVAFHWDKSESRKQDVFWDIVQHDNWHINPSSSSSQPWWNSPCYF